jgi:hypothetical protein
MGRPLIQHIFSLIEGTEFSPDLFKPDASHSWEANSDSQPKELETTQLIEYKSHCRNLLASFFEVLIPYYSLRAQCLEDELCSRSLTPLDALATLNLRQPLHHRICTPINQRQATRSPRRILHGHRSDAQSI